MTPKNSFGINWPLATNCGPILPTAFQTSFWFPTIAVVSIALFNKFTIVYLKFEFNTYAVQMKKAYQNLWLRFFLFHTKKIIWYIFDADNAPWK